MYKIVNSNKLDKILNVEIKVDGEPWISEVDKAFKNSVKNLSIPGFRKGKIPEKKAKEFVNYGLVYEKAANKILDKVFKEILNEAIVKNDNDVIELNPDVDVKKIDDNAFEFIFKFDLIPPIKLPDYKKIENIKTIDDILDNDIEHQIKLIMKNDAEIVDKEDQVIEMFDLAIIDFKGIVDGKQLDSATANDYELEIGSNSFINGFESSLVGMKKNETKVINLKFPDDYHVYELKGKPVTFEVTIKSVKVIKYPDLNIDYIKTLKNGNYADSKSIDEFKSKIKEDLIKNAKINLKNSNTATIKKFLIDNSILDYIPEKLVKDQYQKIMNTYLSQIKKYNLELKDALAMQNITEEKFKEEITKEAEANVKYSLVLEKISDENNIECTNEDIDNRINEIFLEFNSNDKEKQKDLIMSNLNSQRDLIETMVISDKIVNFLIDINKK
ncbi:trigger factor [Mycoplasmoides alvi]|uniref:trigger factor n=1 Tax=Mycoplasmoides alvi TaxID=78580 RepID=UPI00051C4C94|nr:trigger factor [Mycoplasmoides alvi]